MRTGWLMKRRGDGTDEASNGDLTLHSTLVDVARERFNEATVDHLVAVAVFGLPYRCWRCGDVSTPIVGMAEPGTDVFSEELVVCDDEELLGLAWQYLPAEARERWRVGEVRRRHSRTVGAAYLSNGCVSCGALFGAFPLHEELVEALATGGAGALVELAVVSMPASTWTEAYESRWS
jgi:hypothetical protein